MEEETYLQLNQVKQNNELLDANYGSLLVKHSPRVAFGNSAELSKKAAKAYAYMQANDLLIIGASIAAAKTVQAHDFISAFPDGYNTILNANGGGLSQGQKQLISFARVLLSDPRVLILDEATSSVDTETEKAIQNGLDKLLKGRTSFIIAHRLSTIRNSDTIFFVNHGEIVERGNHEELMKLKGHYFEMVSKANKNKQ